MKKYLTIPVLAICVLFASSCSDSQTRKDKAAVARQQAQYGASQPIPAFNWSLERHLMIELYGIRNAELATHAVWRSDYGMIEGDCPAFGYGLPYDTSLTNPLKRVTGFDSVIEQAEPNGVFASKNTNATWVMCVGSAGIIEPVYIESKVTIYPGPVTVDYDKNRVARVGDATVNIRKKK
jgi:hypothetical protein